MTIVSDEELVAQCKKELPARTHSYEMLVQRHMDRVYGMAYRIVGNKEEAEEIAQDVFLKAYHRLKSARPSQPGSTVSRRTRRWIRWKRRGASARQMSASLAAQKTKMKHITR